MSSWVRAAMISGPPEKQLQQVVIRLSAQRGEGSRNGIGSDYPAPLVFAEPRAQDLDAAAKIVALDDDAAIIPAPSPEVASAPLVTYVAQDDPRRSRPVVHPDAPSASTARVSISVTVRSSSSTSARVRAGLARYAVSSLR